MGSFQQIWAGDVDNAENIATSFATLYDEISNVNAKNRGGQLLYLTIVSSPPAVGDPSKNDCAGDVYAFAVEADDWPPVTMAKTNGSKQMPAS